jgi:hypothetical protein
MYINKKTFRVDPESTLHVYDDDPILERKKRRDWFHVDDLIAPVVLELNKKGFETMYSCQGHPWFYNEEHPYVLFDENSNIPLSTSKDDVLIVDEPYILFKNWVRIYDCPDGWSIDDDHRAIRSAVPDKWFYSADYYDVFQYQIDLYRDMLEWAKSLPNYDEVMTYECKCIKNFFEKLYDADFKAKWVHKYIDKSNCETRSFVYIEQCANICYNRLVRIIQDSSSMNIDTYNKIYSAGTEYYYENSGLIHPKNIDDYYWMYDDNINNYFL